MEDYEITIATYEELQREHPSLIRKGFGFECDRGWVGILDRFFSGLDELLPIGVDFQLRQVKEKFAGLRIYYQVDSDIPAEMEEKIHRLGSLATARSCHTCETCGRPGRVWQRGGFYVTSCDRHTLDRSEGYSHKPVRVPMGPHYVRLSAGWLRYDKNADDLVPSNAPPGWGDR